MEKETIIELESGSSKPHSMQNSLWKKLQNCRKRNYITNEMTASKQILLYSAGPFVWTRGVLHVTVTSLAV